MWVRVQLQAQSSLVTVYNNQSNNMKTLLLLSILGLALVCAEVKTAEDQHIEEAEVVPIRRDDSGRCEEFTDKEKPRRKCKNAEDSDGHASCLWRDNKCTEMSCIEQFDSCFEYEFMHIGVPEAFIFCENNICKMLDIIHNVAQDISKMIAKAQGTTTSLTSYIHAKCAEPLAKCVRELERSKCPVVGFP